MTDFTILVLPGAYATSVAVTVDMLEAATRLAPRVRRARPTWRVVSIGGGLVPLSNGLQISTTRVPRRSTPNRATWIIPGLARDDASTLATFLATPDARRAARAVAAHVAHGGRVAASCSAVFLLAAAGLLPDRRVTTTWWLAPELRRLEPRCHVDADRMVCADGPIHTGGAAFAQTDLMLHLLRLQFGAGLADTISRMLLIDGRHAQAPFVVPTLLASGNELVARVVARIEAALPTPPSVETLARELAMSPRTLSRYVHDATGRSTLALIQSVRLHRARLLIESSRLSIEAVAEQVGYADATALRRLIRKVAGSTPSRYRAAAATA